MSNTCRVMKPIDRSSYYRPAVCLNMIHELIGKHRLACRIDTVNRNTRWMRQLECDDSLSEFGKKF